MPHFPPHLTPSTTMPPSMMHQLPSSNGLYSASTAAAVHLPMGAFNPGAFPSIESLSPPPPTLSSSSRPKPTMPHSQPHHPTIPDMMSALRAASFGGFQEIATSGNAHHQLYSSHTTSPSSQQMHQPPRIPPHFVPPTSSSSSMLELTSPQQRLIQQYMLATMTNAMNAQSGAMVSLPQHQHQQPPPPPPPPSQPTPPPPPPPMPFPNMSMSQPAAVLTLLKQINDFQQLNR